MVLFNLLFNQLLNNKRLLVGLYTNYLRDRLLYPTIIIVASSYSHRINGRSPSLAGLDLLLPLTFLDNSFGLWLCASLIDDFKVIYTIKRPLCWNRSNLDLQSHSGITSVFIILELIQNGIVSRMMIILHDYHLFLYRMSFINVVNVDKQLYKSPGYF